MTDELRKHLRGVGAGEQRASERKSILRAEDGLIAYRKVRRHDFRSLVERGDPLVETGGEVVIHELTSSPLEALLLTASVEA